MYRIVIEPEGNGWICYNVESQQEVDYSISRGGHEMPQAEAQHIFGKYINLASPLTTKVSSDGKTVKFIPPSESELDKEYAVDNRIRRNRLLKATDYLVTPDYPISEENRNLVYQYRQKLRDVTEQPGWPRNVVWPEKPSI